eukprot:1097652-Pelagomonas_calceolata.AAC.6
MSALWSPAYAAAPACPASASPAQICMHLHADMHKWRMQVCLKAKYAKVLACPAAASLAETSTKYTCSCEQCGCSHIRCVSILMPVLLRLLLLTPASNLMRALLWLILITLQVEAACT